MTETKEKNKNKWQTESVFEKSFGEKHNISLIARNHFYVSLIITPLSKPQNCRENCVSCHNVKATQQTQTKNENQPKNQNKKMV